MVDEKDCFRVSYLSGPLTIAIVLLAFEDITFSPSPLILTVMDLFVEAP